MTVKIQSVHFDADKKLLDFVQERVDKLTTFYDGIINGSIVGCPFHGFDQPFPAKLFLLAQDAYTTPVGLFRIIGLVKNLGDVIFNNRSDSSCPTDKFIWVPVTYKPVGGRQVVFGGTVTILDCTSPVISDSFFIVKY